MFRIDDGKGAQKDFYRGRLAIPVLQIPCPRQTAAWNIQAR